MTYLWLWARTTIHIRRLPLVVAVPLTGVLISLAFSFKVAFTNEDSPELVVGAVRSVNDLLHGPSLVARARLVFSGTAALACFAVYAHFTSDSRGSDGTGKYFPISTVLRPACTNTLKMAELLHDLYVLIAMTQSRITNVPLFLLMQIQFKLLQWLDSDPVDLSTFSLLFQYMSFFAFGGSNAISSVDLSSAYNGVSGFNIVAVGILTFVGNWAGPIFWASATVVLLLEARSRRPVTYKQHVGVMTVFTSCSVAFVMAACTVLRTHLFIWTVFSPKYLFTMAWSLGQNLLINVGYGAVLYWIGSR
jgi:ethanolamine phosphate transferase 2 subunit G